MYVQHGLHFSEGQIKNLCLLRRAYLQKLGMLEMQKQGLETQLEASCTQGLGVADELLQQIQVVNFQMQEATVLYKAIMYDGVSINSCWVLCCTCQAQFCRGAQGSAYIIDVHVGCHILRNSSHCQWYAAPIPVKFMDQTCLADD